jgi:hypothetical protein
MNMLLTITSHGHNLELGLSLANSQAIAKLNSGHSLN